MNIIGLTGLIGSGKSEVGRILTQLKIEVIDTDLIAKSITQKDGLAINIIKREYGADFITAEGDLDRNKMRNLVFSDNDARIKLESILHPLIFTQVQQQVQQSSVIYTVIMIPLLFKTANFLKYIHRSIFIDCEEQLLISRVESRNNFSRQQIMNILAAQTPRELQLVLCDDVLINNGTIAQLEANVLQLHNKYLNLFKTK
jgi:dephospho-CoA kinase